MLNCLRANTSRKCFSFKVSKIDRDFFDKVLAEAEAETNYKPSNGMFISNEEFEAKKAKMEESIKENPLFLEAFPHIKNLLEQDVTKMPIDEEQYSYSARVQEQPGFFTNLERNSSVNNTVGKDIDERMIQNKENYSEAYFSQNKPKFEMSREEMDAIHDQIDLKLEELEQTGLSREEILLNKAEGIPLVDDKFFQFIKGNRAAREMLVTKNQEFSVESVVNIALGQDIGPDSSTNASLEEVQTKDTLYENVKMDDEVNKMYLSKKKTFLFRSEDIDFQDNLVEKLKQELNAQS